MARPPQGRPHVTLQADRPALVLASASTARADLLRAAGLNFTVQPARVDEDALRTAARSEGLSASDTALMLASHKAQRVSRADPDALVIGCDQILVCGDRWFDKPHDLTDAAEHLRALRGQTHQLMTAVLCVTNGMEVWRHVARPTLKMRRFSDAFLEQYLALEADHVTHSVGGYRLEGPGIHLFERLDGEHAAILGLPMLALLSFLRQHNVLIM